MKRSSNLSALLAMSLLLFALLACSGGDTKDSSAGPIPPDKKDYIGHWRGTLPDGSFMLSISSDGTVNYERKEGSSSKRISSGKIKKFIGNDFEVEAFIVSTTFKVEKPPFRDGSVWKMVVDGVEVSRKDTSASDSSSSNEKSTELKLTNAEMRKDDGSGKMSDEVVTSYTQADKKLHCSISWENSKPATRIKFIYIAVDAGDAKNETIKEISLVTENEEQNTARGTITLTNPLPKGSYKVDIYFNDKLERSVPFKIV